MAEFVWLQKGDRLPAVAVAQLLLKRSGHGLVIDGILGDTTDQAVRAFQRERNLAVDGIIGEQTWPRLDAHERLQIIDCIDVFDPDLFRMEVRDLTRSGARPITIGGMCNGI